MSDSAISVHNVTKTYSLYQKPIHRLLELFHPLGKKYHTPFCALDNIHFDIKKGQALGIIGRNGSGKSSLLQLITGIQQPTAGVVQVNGRISALLELGAGFNPEFTGRENVYLNTAIQGFSEEDTDERFQRIAEFADIGEFIDRPVKTYSSGMYIRLAFAAAVSVQPEILIVDEALSVGDIFFQQKCMTHMKKMMEGCTIVLVSHDMHSIINLCDRVLLLDNGQVTFDGDPMEGVSQYTKILHDEHFSGGQETENVERAEVLPQDITEKIAQLADDFSQWTRVPDKKRSGVGQVAIESLSITSQGKPINVVQQGDLITIRMLVHAATDMDEIIFGYNIKDRIGNALFGENSLCLDASALHLDAGYNFVEYSFIWPEVYPYKYTITVGIGQGLIPLGHVVQCWAHDIASITAVTPGRSIHGMFNNNLEALTVTSVKSST
ncbi:ABC transporter ATP-binding protein [Desulfobulbus sp. US2]|nr:ABC transporter ATP-binding protein [Desulfobulbus sp. US4]MCW5207410.1 ABC transporter ATP-binding protein [Desulfobulbus sp. US2]WLE97234.1 MAG: ABC transporter ATP-binding protein [Candidatus Electrothrix communis]